MCTARTYAIRQLQHYRAPWLARVGCPVYGPSCVRSSFHGGSCARIPFPFRFFRSFFSQQSIHPKDSPTPYAEMSSSDGK